MIEIYPERESKTLEFKERLPNFSHLIKTCVAFANGTGGKLIIGIADDTREIIGINDDTRNRIYDEFPNSLYDATSPCLLVEIYEKCFNNANVLIIDVPSSIKKPVFVKSEGSLNGVYLRAGSNTRKATKEYIEELIRENKREQYDEEIIHADTSILSENLLRAVYKKTNLELLIAEKILIRSTTDPHKYYPTIAGTLVFCERPDQHLPEALVLCSRFNGIAGRDLIQTEEIHGNIEKQIETSFQLIKSWLVRDYKLQGSKLKGKILIPEEALREAIVNAIIHRKYWLPGAVKIALYDNRLEIFSPGNFPGLMDPKQLGDGTTYLRNPHLARMARRCGLIEKLGTGIRLIIESCHKARIKRPEFIEGADSVKVVFSFLPENDKALSDELKILEFINLKKELKLPELENYLNISRNTATRKLNRLIKSGKIQRNGKGPAVTFTLS